MTRLAAAAAAVALFLAACTSSDSSSSRAGVEATQDVGSTDGVASDTEACNWTDDPATLSENVSGLAGALAGRSNTPTHNQATDDDTYNRTTVGAIYNCTQHEDIALTLDMSQLDGDFWINYDTATAEWADMPASKGGGGQDGGWTVSKLQPGISFQWMTGAGTDLDAFDTTGQISGTLSFDLGTLTASWDNPFSGSSSSACTTSSSDITCTVTQASGNGNAVVYVVTNLTD